jgi:hypothetical protein
MSVERAEALWRRAISAIEAGGRLSPDATALTPAELAVRLRAAGDDRLRQFVEGYYYPARYGHRAGALTEDAAERLVREIEGSRAIRRGGGGLLARGLVRAARVRCPVCGKQQGPNDEGDGR